MCWLDSWILAVTPTPFWITRKPNQKANCKNWTFLNFLKMFLMTHLPPKKMKGAIFVKRNSQPEKPWSFFTERDILNFYSCSHSRDQFFIQHLTNCRSHFVEENPNQKNYIPKTIDSYSCSCRSFRRVVSLPNLPADIRNSPVFSFALFQSPRSPEKAEPLKKWRCLIITFSEHPRKNGRFL